MQPLFEHRPELGGVTTRALELEGDAPALLLLHGYSDSADTWRRLLALLAKDGRRALAVDMPGFGAADRLDRDAAILPQLDAFAAAAVARLAEESGQDVWVVGNSLGGVVALRLAERDDLPLAGVIPIAPAGFDHPAWMGIINAQPATRFLLSGAIPFPESVVRAAVGAVYRQLAFAHPRAMGADVVSAFTGHMARQRDVRRILATGRRLIPELRHQAAFRLDQLKRPVVLIWGDRDRMVSHKGARHLQEAIPELRYELLAGVGHCPQLEVPERVAEIVLEVTDSARADSARRRTGT